MKVCIAVLSICTACSLAVGAESKPLAAAKKCEEQPYRGIDSRLKPDLLGVVPNLKETIVGFELVNHLPVIALHDQLLDIGQKNIARLNDRTFQSTD